MAEEQQVTKEPQQVTTKEPQRVTMKDPNKVKAGKRLAEYNHRKREVKKAQGGGVNQYYGIGAVNSCWGDRWSWLLHLSNQERQASGEVPNSPTPRNPSKLLPQSNKVDMD